MRSRLPILSCCLFVLAWSVVAAAQDPARRQLVVPLKEGGFVAFKSETGWAESNRAQLKAQDPLGSFDTKALQDDGHIIHRVLVDGQGNAVFGYDLFVEPQPGSRQFRIALSPLNADFAEKLVTGNPVAQPSLKKRSAIATLPQSAEPQLLDDGDSFALDLLVNQNTGVKIVDVVKVSFDRATLWEANPRSVPRDFTLDAVEMAVNEYRLLINGEVIAMGKPASNQSGALLWFYITGRGRFIFSLVPREGYGFQKVGYIENNRIEFTLRGDRYEWISNVPVLPGGGTWSLWVLHDPRYTPPIDDATAYSQRKYDQPNKIDTAADKLWNRANQIIPEPQQTTLTRINEKPRQTAARPNQLPPQRTRVLTGGADRIDNLWPRN